jgi:TP901 family phage tail tape measure protein
VAGGRIAGITIEFNGDTTKLKTALKDVDSQVRQSQTQLKDVNKLLKFDPGNTELLQQKYNSLTKSIEGTKSRLETLREAQRQMEQNGLKGTDQWDALQREIAETEQKLKSLNREMDQFGSVQAQKVAAAGEKVQQVGQNLENTGRALLPASAAMIGFGTVAATKFAEVDKTMTLTNQTMNNTAEEAEMLERAMSDAAANSTFGMNDAANAALNFARAGLDAKSASAALAPAMNLAAGEGGNLDTVSAGLVATINGFHDSFDQAGHYADVFAAACNNSALDVDSLSHAMSVAAPIFSSAGYSVNDAALYMGIMANNGIDADKAANSLKTGIARLVSPAKEGAEMMKQLGISVTNTDGSMKSSIEIQNELHTAFSKLSESEQIAAASAIFGKNQMAPWLALINTAPSDVNDLSESLATCAGTTNQMADAMMGGFGGSIEKLKSSLDVLMTTLGKTVAEFLTPIIAGIQKFVDWLNSLDAGTRRVIVTIGAIVAAAGPVLITVGKMAQGVGALMKLAPKIVTAFGKIKGLLATLGGALKSLWGVLAANPIILVIAAVAALVAGFIYLWNHS